jgi:hypothetical protein
MSRNILDEDTSAYALQKPYFHVVQRLSASGVNGEV